MKGVLLKQRSSRRTTLTQATATTQLLNGGVVVGGGDYDGWFGDPESDIPLSLLPKHVTGLHAADDMAMLTVSQSVPCSLSAPRSFAAFDLSEGLRGHPHAEASAERRRRRRGTPPHRMFHFQRGGLRERLPRHFERRQG